MINSVLSDFCRVLFFPKDKKYLGDLNPLHRDYAVKFGLEYPILDYFEFNMELIDLYQLLRSDNKVKVDLYTTDVIQKHPMIKADLKHWFDSVNAVSDFKLSKSDPKAFTFIADKLGRSVDSFVFIDDKQVNIEAAKRAGMKAIQYENNEQTIRELKMILNL